MHMWLYAQLEQKILDGKYLQLHLYLIFEKSSLKLFSKIKLDELDFLSISN